jgi:arylsulfatase A-like enzyme
VIGGCGEDTPPPRPAESESRPRNIFLVVIDTLRADYLGLYGHPRDTTPTLDRLGRAGVVFERVFATAPSTLESVASLLTGTAQLAPRWPIRSLPREVRPLQSLFKEAGYRTYGVVANPWLATRPRLFERDFDDHWSITDWKEVASNTTRDATQVILDALDRHVNQPKPGFFYLHYIDPHDPYRPPQRYGFYEGPLPFASIQLHRASGEDAVRRKRDEYGYTGLPQPESLSPEQMRLIRAQYAEELRYVDDSLASILDLLEERRLLHDSLIVVTSDHGEEFLEHGLLKHGFSLHDELLHVPLIFHWPAWLRPERRDDLASGVDLAPTLLDLAGLEVPEYMTGYRLFGEGRGEAPVPIRTHFINQDQRGFRTGKWKFIRNIHTDRDSIYDLENDPGEHRPVTDEAVHSELSRLYDDIERRHALAPAEEGADPVEIDDATRKHLEALGYVPE